MIEAEFEGTLGYGFACFVPHQPWYEIFSGTDEFVETMFDVPTTGHILSPYNDEWYKLDFEELDQ